MQRSLRQATEAASEIVGAMLLILIVTVAAAGFGTFLLNEQEKTEEAKALQNAREREHLVFLDIDADIDDWFDEGWVEGDPAPSSRYDRYKQVTFTLQGAHPDSFEVDEFILNGVHVKDATLERFDPDAGWQASRLVRDADASGHPDYAAFEAVEKYPVRFSAREKVQLTINLRDSNYAAQGPDPTPYDPDGASIDFFTALPPALLSDGYVRLEVLTGHFNKFTGTWVPPTARMGVPALSGGSEDPDQALNVTAAGSFHPYEDNAKPVRTVAWDWVTILPRRDAGAASEVRTVQQASGMTAQLSFQDPVNTNWLDNCHQQQTVEAILLVTADNGLTSTSKRTHTLGGTHPGGPTCPA